MPYTNILEIGKNWIFGDGLKIVAILIIATIIHKISYILIESVIRRVILTGKGSKEAEKKREDTLIRVFDGTAHVVLWIFAGIMILAEFSIDIAPLIAGAGIVGLAFGFGGQYLIRDIISGLFIIFENQYRVGDIVFINGVTGAVEDITLRTTILRDANGVVHFIPNGGITQAANHSKDFSRINLNIGVDYKTDLEKLEKVINQVGQDLANHPDWQEKITQAPRFSRIENFGPSEVIVKIIGETQPKAQWEVAGELRKQLKQAFDRENIEIPFPQQVIHQASK